MEAQHVGLAGDKLFNLQARNRRHFRRAVDALAGLRMSLERRVKRKRPLIDGPPYSAYGASYVIEDGRAEVHKPAINLHTTSRNRPVFFIRDRKQKPRSGNAFRRCRLNRPFDADGNGSVRRTVKLTRRAASQTARHRLRVRFDGRLVLLGLRKITQKLVRNHIPEVPGEVFATDPWDAESLGWPAGSADCPTGFRTRKPSKKGGAFCRPEAAAEPGMRLRAGFHRSR